MSARPPGTAALLGLISNATVDPKYPTPGTPAREQRCPTARASGRSSPTSSPSGRKPTVRKRTRSPAARAPVCENRGRSTCFVNQSRRSRCVSSAEKRSGRSVRVQISASSRRAASASSSRPPPLDEIRLFRNQEDAPWVVLCVAVRRAGAPLPAIPPSALRPHR